MADRKPPTTTPTAECVPDGEGPPAPPMPSRPIRPATRDRVTPTAMTVYALAKLALMAGLPLIVTFDSMHYLTLSEILGGVRPWEEWNYVRTPGFPSYLLCVSRLLGLTAPAFVASQTVVGILAALALAAVLRRAARPWTAVVFLALLASYPLMVGYEHVLLTEVVSAALFAGLVWAATLDVRPRWLHCLLLGSAVGLAYLVRQTFVAMLPLVLLAAVLRRAQTEVRRGQTRTGGMPVPPDPAHPGNQRGEPGRRALAAAVALAVGAAGYYGMTARWQARAAEHRAAGTDLLLFLGALNYGLIDSGLPEFAAAREAYDAMIAGPPPGDAGYTDLRIMPIRDIAKRSFEAEQGRIALRSLAANPGGYAAAVWRNLRLFYGLSQDKSENAIWPVTAMRSSYEGNVRVGEPYRTQAFELFEQPYSRGALARYYARMVRPYQWLLLAAAGLSLAGGIAMLLRREWADGLLVLSPHYMIGLHALLLTGIDRYAFPFYPGMLAMGIWAGWWMGRWMPGVRGPRTSAAQSAGVGADAIRSASEAAPTHSAASAWMHAATWATVAGLLALANVVLQP